MNPTFLEIVLPLIGLAWVCVLYCRKPGLLIDEIVDQRPTLIASELDTPEPDPFTELDREWLALHQIEATS